MLISQHVKDYVTIKRCLGYRFVEQERMLLAFAAFAEAHGDKFITTDSIIAWASQATSVHSSREWFRTARNFAISMHAEDDHHEIPPRDVFGRGKRSRPAPHILTRPQIEKILTAALSLPPIASITPYTYHYIIGLMAATALRVSEATALLLTDLTSDGLVIRETKFRKNRLVPIDSTTRKALNEYLKIRKRIGGPSDHMFVISTGEPPDRSSTSRAFIKLARQTGLRAGSGEQGPRLHDLRHSFACRSLEQCGNERDAVNRHMLALSTYLGHACLSDTYWYLESTPVLFRQIAEATEATHMGDRS